jgi:hypothetical protein
MALYLSASDLARARSAAAFCAAYWAAALAAS